jgi:DNA (cytosine-5)-methyltransferase 1
MRLGSLCSGYGGLETGISQVLDIEPVWCSEIDQDASKVLATHHPSVPNLGDLTVLDWHQVEPVDIMCAGFPCQPFSHAGKRQGADDERAIFQYIADGIGVLRPGLVVLENVPGILTLGGVSVIGTLTRLGYDCRWGIVRASDTGAPHKRARWFCIAEPADASDFGHERAGGSRRRRIGSTNGSGAAADASGAERRTSQHETVDTATRSAAEPGERDSAPAANADGAGSQGPESAERRNMLAWGRFGTAVTGWERILGRRAPDPVDDKRRLSPRFVEWMMGLDQGYICDVGLSRTAALKMLGNGVVPQQAALAVDLLL